MAKQKKKPKWNSNAAFRGALRRVFARSPVVRAARDAVRREVNRYNKDGSLAKRKGVEYQCAVCGKWFPSKFIAVDHIDPVINPETGWIDWNDFIDRLDCSQSNLQVVCSYTKKHEDATHEFGKYSCHYEKTQSERVVLKNLSK